MKRVLFVSHSSELNGSEKSLFDLMKSINTECFLPIVIFPREGPFREDIENLGIKTYIIRLPSWSYAKDTSPFQYLKSLLGRVLLTASSIYSITRIISYERIDLVYTNSIVVYSGAVAASIARRPHIWHVREILGDRSGLSYFLPSRLLLLIVSKLSNAIIANSQATAKQFDHVKQDNVLVIHNGINPEEFKRVRGHTEASVETKGKWQVAVIGRLYELKAQDDAIRAVSVTKNAIPEIELLLVGDGDEKYRKYLVDLAGSLSVSDKVVFTGYRKDVPDILSNVKVVIIPSMVESFSRVAIEAMAAGVPVIASDTGGLTEIVRDGFNGVLVPVKDPDAIAGKLEYYYCNDHILREHGDAARAWVSSNFSIDTYARRVQEVISLIAD